ncbi:MAG: CerR family C-terminal domain-containing protein [Candidatus Binatia bacterium]
MESGQATRAAETRRRLLEAAVEVFAEEGFRGATLQEIARRADANVASTAYHFGNKEGLYAAVFEYAERRMAELRPPQDDAEDAALPAEERLRRHVTAFLTRLLDPRRPAWFARLLAREMIEPTPALDRLVRRRMRANHEQLAAILRDLLGSRATDEDVRLCTLSVVAQCTFYRHSAPIVARLYPELAPAREIERIADHVTRFSLAAARGLRGRGKERGS